MSQQKTPFPETSEKSKSVSEDQIPFDHTEKDQMDHFLQEEIGNPFPRIVARMPDLGNRLSLNNSEKYSFWKVVDLYKNLIGKISISSRISRKAVLWSSAAILLFIVSACLWLISSEEIPSNEILDNAGQFVVQIDGKDLKGNESLHGLLPGIAESKENVSLNTLGSPTLAKNQEPDILACLPQNTISAVSTLDIPEYPGRKVPSTLNTNTPDPDKKDPFVQFPSTFSQEATLPGWNDLAELDKKESDQNAPVARMPIQNSPVVQTEEKIPVQNRSFHSAPQNFNVPQIPVVGNVQNGGIVDPYMMPNQTQVGMHSQYSQPSPYQVPIYTPAPGAPVMNSPYNVPNHQLPQYTGQINPQSMQNYQQVSYPVPNDPRGNGPQGAPVPNSWPQGNPTGIGQPIQAPVPVSMNPNDPVSHTMGDPAFHQNGQVYRIASTQTTSMPSTRSSSSITTDQSYTETVKQNTTGRFQGYSIDTGSVSSRPTNYSSRDSGYNTNRNLW